MNNIQNTEEMTLKYAERLTPARLEKLDKVINQRTRHFTLVLEDLKDPHNISAVMRTSEVFGFQDIHIIEELNYYTVSKAILKGSFKWLDIYRYSKRLTALKHLKQKGYQIAVASSRTATPLSQVDLRRPTAFYMGSESLGNHPDTLKEADIHFKIPQYGLTESMNVSVCAGVLSTHLDLWLTAQGRQKYTISGEEQNKLRLDFYQRSALGVERNSPIHFVVNKK
jgi:tRNA (guanosine-2'-O-)-methyltransferase